MRFGTAAVVLALTGALAPSADASVYVLGEGQAHTCSVYALMGRDSYQAEQTCTAALEGETLTMRNLAATYVNRGVIRFNLKQFDKAFQDYTRAIQYGSYLSQPELGLAYIDLASAQIALHRYNEALDSIDKAFSLGTMRPEMAYYFRAQAEEYLGNAAAAYRDYKEALTIAPDFTAAQEDLKRFRVVTKPAEGS